ncbi:hypothetical protein M434DRAFT_32809 [Hypoxylon sp. CO27-5]|nr:hypothetical protein M434DRAFT_32809 [Hypoxylon sp. CO27-5]
MAKFDWDDMLLSMDWVNENWRMHINTLNAVPWEELQSSTVDRLAELHRAYDAAHPGARGTQISPAGIERFRRQTTMGESQSARDWITDKGPSSPVAKPVAVKKPRGPNVDKENKWVHKHDRPGFMTVGFELELPIAVFARGGRHHPEDTRWLASDPVNDYMPYDSIKKIVVDEVISVLNSKTEGMVFIPKDEDEGSELHSVRMDNLHRMDTGGTPTPSGHGLPISAVAENAAQAALRTALLSVFSTEAGGKSLAVATESDIADAVNFAAVTGIVLTVDRTRAKSRLTELLRLEAYRARRDPRHVPLVHMKPRYRAFSVYTVTEKVPRQITMGDYLDAPPADSLPEKPYHYEAVKIASPVMRMEYPPADIEQVMSQITKAMRSNFLVHKAMSSIGTTAQITISHSTGFTLLDIKRLVTLVSIVGDGLARLNREYRSSAQYDSICGPIKRVSRLAGVASVDPKSPNFDPEKIIPAGTTATRRADLAEMEKHVPVDLLSKQLKLKDKVFYSVLWQYRSVNAIAKAVRTGQKSRKTEMEVKCTGLGNTTEKVEIKEEAALRAKWLGEDLNLNVIDAERGVFEFRRCAASLDTGFLVCWMVVCYYLVDTAKFLPAAEFKDVLTKILNDKPILDALRIPKKVQSVYKDAIGDSGFFEPPGSKVSWKTPFYPADA